MKNKYSIVKEKGLSAWQLTMMALGTVIGGSFFLGSSVAIAAAGPAILISFILGGFLVYYILFALSEMTVSNPSAGSFRTYATQAYGPGAGFVVGWVYWTGMVVGMSSEATAVSILIRQWYPNMPISLLGSGIIVAITLLNLLGADKLSKLESGLAIIKILAIGAFIITGALLLLGWIPKIPSVGLGELRGENFFPGGIKGIAGSMLLVMFAYAGFEIIGLAASETDNPQVTIPKAINHTVIALVGLYIVGIAVLLPLIPTGVLNENTSPMVAALDRWGMSWAGTVLNLVLITAILSTMLAAMFGLGRMMRSLADAGQAPAWLKDKRDVPIRGILFSGISMLAGLGLGLLFPRVYLFLVSSGGFSVLFSYAVIVASHIRFRKKNGCPGHNCRVRGYPYSSLIALISLVVILVCMPLIPGQGSGFLAGVAMAILYLVAYLVLRYSRERMKGVKGRYSGSRRFKPELSSEFSEELSVHSLRKEQLREKRLNSEKGAEEKEKNKEKDREKR